MDIRSRGGRLVWVMAALALALIGLQPAAGQGDSPEAAALLTLLRFVPDAPEYRAFLVYGDAAAWHAAWDIDRPDSQAALERMSRVDRAYWLSILYQQTAPPDSLGVLYLGTEDVRQRDTYGFNFFDVDRFLAAGEPPDWITLAYLGVEPEAVSAALLESGYAETALAGGGLLYSQRDDYAFDAASPLRSGVSSDMNRVALLDGLTLTGPATDLVTAAAQAGAVDAAGGEAPSLADDPAYQAGVAALTSGAASAEAGLLVGAIFIDGMQFAVEADDASLADVAPLPPVSLAAFGTRHTPGMSSLMLAAVLPPGSDPAAAAEDLGRRLRRYYSRGIGVLLADYWQVETMVGREYGGLPVALVVLRVDDPPPTPDEQPLVDAHVLSWWELIARWDVGFLAFAAE